MSTILTLLLLLSAQPAGLGEGPGGADGLSQSLPTAGSWQARATDNVVGLADLKKLSNPARIDYDHVLDATPEMQEIRRERIDPDSPKGRSLRQQGSDRVTKASQAAMIDLGHCSVWKAISHSEGRQVPNVSQAVKDRLAGVSLPGTS